MVLSSFTWFCSYVKTKPRRRKSKVRLAISTPYRAVFYRLTRPEPTGFAKVPRPIKMMIQVR